MGFFWSSEYEQTSEKGKYSSFSRYLAYSSAIGHLNGMMFTPSRNLLYFWNRSHLTRNCYDFEMGSFFDSSGLGSSCSFFFPHLFFFGFCYWTSEGSFFCSSQSYSDFILPQFSALGGFESGYSFSIVQRSIDLLGCKMQLLNLFLGSIYLISDPK